MTISTKGKKLGDKSIPFLASVFGYNSDQSSINQVDSYNDAGDLENLFNTPATSHHIRISIPDQIKKFTALHFELKFTEHTLFVKPLNDTRMRELKSFKEENQQDPAYYMALVDWWANNSIYLKCTVI